MLLHLSDPAVQACELIRPHALCRVRQSRAKTSRTANGIVERIRVLLVLHIDLLCENERSTNDNDEKSHAFFQSHDAGVVVGRVLDRGCACSRSPGAPRARSLWPLRSSCSAAVGDVGGSTPTAPARRRPPCATSRARAPLAALPSPRRRRRRASARRSARCAPPAPRAPSGCGGSGRRAASRRRPTRATPHARTSASRAPWRAGGAQ
jgi:hypothetical protein